MGNGLASLSSIQFSLNLDHLANRLRLADTCFLSKLVNGLIFRPELLQSLNFHVPQYQSLFCLTFEIPFRRTSYGCKNPIDSISRECNAMINFDLFNMNDLYPPNPYFSVN
ncbi:unnamed protein product [Macrosiphum euphorbiae]|uniref:Uncharacterized protein n=1 Tax=Macrosiphum euphorbiae TaxID=13131 RepID=A0AAV0W2Q1_9HEMI|nr:unnamed protein product [Macrosiphum euphorbiae]